MGPMITKIMENNCISDCIYYVLNDSECHSKCTDDYGCDCETHQVEHVSDELKLDIDGDGIHLSA